jgi:putative aminopeptidase FrvX
MFEAAVSAEIERQVSELKGMRLEKDPFGNLIVSFGGSMRNARFAFVAHMDHPGWQLHPVRRFLGGVPESLRGKRAIREFGDFGMWDLPPCRLDGDRLYSRACDDLIGCATIIATLQDLSGQDSVRPLVAVFTRAEEVGFIGAIQLAKSQRLPADITFVSLETSAERPPARMGGGPIVRVGDRVSIFDPSITEFFVEVAKKQKIQYQRCLMAGGTCEATAFQAFGYRAGALCIALGNYHNCTPDEQIDEEYVGIGDLEGLIDLCVAIASEHGEIADGRAALRKRLESRLEEFPLV